MEKHEQEPNTLVLLNIAAILALALSLALSAPPSEFPLALGAVTSFAGIVLAIVAAFRKEAVFKPNLTNWDGAAFFHALSFACGIFIEPGSYQEVINQAVLPIFAVA